MADEEISIIRGVITSISARASASDMELAVRDADGHNFVVIYSLRGQVLHSREVIQKVLTVGMRVAVQVAGPVTMNKDIYTGVGVITTLSED